MLAMASGQTALAAQYAAIVMDMRNGDVLYETNADRQQAPASLTKMMTLYLTFEAVKNGQLRLDQTVRVSRHAASQPPSKLYLKTGQKVSIRSLIRAAAIKSANDAAVVLAEAISGSEEAFALVMTAKARQLGMTGTSFRNASGLTAPGHVSTPRDMAILGRHLLFDFPQYYNVFGRKSDRAAGKRIWTTNRLLSTYRGADGLKTGYTRAAGYNLAASARRGQERIIAVIFGGKSSRWRNARMAKLLDKGFAKAPTQVASVPPQVRRVQVAEAPLPVPRPGSAVSGFGALAAVLAPEAEAAVPPLTAAAPVRRVSSSPWAPLEAVMPPPRPAAGAANDATADAGATAGVPGVPLPLARPDWAVQLGLFENHEKAIARLNEVMLGDLGTLADAAPVIERVRGRTGGERYRVRVFGLSRDQASHACKSVKAGGRSCEAVITGG